MMGRRLAGHLGVADGLKTSSIHMCVCVHTLECNLPPPTRPGSPLLHPLGQTRNGATIRVPARTFLFLNFHAGARSL